MWHKILIIVLFFALCASLFSGLFFLLKDRGARLRTWHTLSLRLALAALLIATILHGVYTGQLGSKAPWHARYDKAPAVSENIDKQE